MKESLLEDEYTVDVPIQDGTSIGITVFLNSKNKSAPVVVCFPAMGVSAKYYSPLAQNLLKSGLNVVTADLRGNGLSSVRVNKQILFGYKEIIEKDWPAIMQCVRSHFPDSEIYMLGHSLGGQLSTLYLSLQDDPDVSGLILIAASSAYYKLWKFPGSLKIRTVMNSIRFITFLMGYFPGKFLKFGGNESRNVIEDWCQQGRTGKYSIMNSNIDFEERLKNVDVPLLAFSIENDELSPQFSMRHLYSKMSNSSVEHVHFGPESLALKKPNHFNWVKASKPFAYEILDWITKISVNKNTAANF